METYISVFQYKTGSTKEPSNDEEFVQTTTSAVKLKINGVVIPDGTTVVVNTKQGATKVCTVCNNSRSLLYVYNRAKVTDENCRYQYVPDEESYNLCIDSVAKIEILES